MLINCSYNSHNAEISTHLAELNSFLSKHFTKYEKSLILGDFNVETGCQKMKTLCEVYNLKSLIKQPTYYKNPDKVSCLRVLIISRTRFRVNPHFIVACMSRNSLLEAGAKSEV